jgi:hypothetical protein
MICSFACRITSETIKAVVIGDFNNIIQSGKIPKVFKTGMLTLIHKKGKDPTLTTNYRGITVTSVWWIYEGL